MPSRELPAKGREDLPLKENGKRWNAATQYDPSYCDVLINLMSEGATYHEVARKIGVARKTLKVWSERYPEFGEAYAIGKDWARGYLEKTAREHLVTIKEKDMPEVKFDFRVYKHMMAVRFGVTEAETINYTVTTKEQEDEITNIVNEAIKQKGGV